VILRYFVNITAENLQYLFFSKYSCIATWDLFWLYCGHTCNLWDAEGDPSAIKQVIAPDGYRLLHVHRSASVADLPVKD